MNILNINNRQDFRKWLSNNSTTTTDCYILLKRGQPKDDNTFYYIDAVEEAICFGWIDSTLKKIGDKNYQRFSKRVPNSTWTELNKERARRLIKLNLMTEEGYKSLPNLDEEYHINQEILNDIKKENLLEIFLSFPKLYQVIRSSNLLSMKKISQEEYTKSFNNFIKNTKEGKMYGTWNDYGRLSNYK